MYVEKPSFFERLNLWVRNSVTVRLFTIGFLILLLLIPLSFVEDLIRERQDRRNDVVFEVSDKWGLQQTVTGLILTIPYFENTKVQKADTDKFRFVRTIRYAHFLPDQLNIEGEVFPELRSRGIYDVVLYSAKLNLSGNFSQPKFEEDWKIQEQDILWKDAFVSLGLSDARGIQREIPLKWNGEEHYFTPGLPTQDVIPTGVSAKIPAHKNTLTNSEINFSLVLDLHGSSTIQFTPIGKTTHVVVKSTWENPSFDGAFLPDTRNISHDGFSAEWNVLNLNLPYPQFFTGVLSEIEKTSFGFSLLIAVDEYQKNMRAIKYASMFIVLTFLVLFFIGILRRVRIHPIQYIIVGLSLCVFYTLLIGLSEHILFDWSYLISSISIMIMITLFTKTISKDKNTSSLVFGVLLLLYLFIYTTIQLESYALLMGSVGLFVVLAIVMYLSRNINWYDIQERKNKD